MQGPFVNAQGMTSQGQPIMQPNIQVPQDQVQAIQAPVADAQFYNMPSSQGPVLPQQQQPSQLPLQSNPAVQLNDPQSLAYIQQVNETLIDSIPHYLTLILFTTVAQLMPETFQTDALCHGGHDTLRTLLV